MGQAGVALAPARPCRTAEQGVGLVEVIVATVVAVIAILALAYSFGTGRGLINRFEIARMALAAAQSRMEWLAAQPATAPELVVGFTHAPSPVTIGGRGAAFESWSVQAYDDPANGLGQTDLKQVTVTVSWGRGGPPESVRLTRLFPLQ